MDFTSSRIREYCLSEPSIGLQRLADVYEEYFEAIKKLPNYMKPRYVGRVIETVYSETVKEIMRRRMSD